MNNCRQKKPDYQFASCFESCVFSLKHLVTGGGNWLLGHLWAARIWLLRLSSGGPVSSHDLLFWYDFGARRWGTWCGLTPKRFIVLNKIEKERTHINDTKMQNFTGNGSFPTRFQIFFGHQKRLETSNPRSLSPVFHGAVVQIRKIASPSIRRDDVWNDG